MQTVNVLELDRAEDFFIAHDSAAAVAHLAAMLRRDPSNSIAANRLVSALVHRRWAVPGTPTLRHAERVPMASFSLDGHRVLSACWDKTACVWNAATGERVVAVRHGDVVSSARFSADGSRFVTASADGAARVWDATTGAALTPWLRHSDRVNRAEFSGDGQFVLTASADQSAKVWDAATGQEVGRLVGHKSWVNSLVFWPDGKKLASGSADQTIHIWDVPNRKCVDILRGHRQQVLKLALMPDHQTLVSGCRDGTICLWETSIEHPRRPRIEIPDSALAWAFEADSKSVVTFNDHGRVTRWKGANFELPEPLLETGEIADWNG
jgi:WD40 repeat protein